jgi:hypothetical protein
MRAPLAGSETGAVQDPPPSSGSRHRRKGHRPAPAPCGSAMVIAEPAPCPTALASALGEQPNGEGATWSSCRCVSRTQREAGCRRSFLMRCCVRDEGWPLGVALGRPDPCTAITMAVHDGDGQNARKAATSTRDNGPLSRWERFLTVPWLVTMGMLALIAGTVSYLHTHLLLGLYGRPGWVAALTPLSVDGMIVAASTALLADWRGGCRRDRRRRDNGTLGIHRGRLRPPIEMLMATTHTARTIHQT